MRQTDAQYGLPNSPYFVQYEQSALLFIFQEDFGGHHEHGPASPWAIEELRPLQGANDAQRGAAFLCRLSEADNRRSLGFLSNMDTFRSQLYDGWPSLSSSGDNLVCDAPCPRRALVLSLTKHLKA